MKNLSVSFASALLVLLASQAASATDPVFFKAPIMFAGTGCPVGSIPPPTGVNTATLSILFGRYDAGMSAASGMPLHAACNFAVPVHVPQGFQLSVLTADWQGFDKGSGTLQRKYFVLPGPPGPNVPWKINNYNNSGNFLADDNLIHTTATTGCAGGDFNLRINSNITANNSSSYIAVDTLDLQNKVVFHLNWSPCTPGTSPTNPHLYP